MQEEYFTSFHQKNPMPGIMLICYVYVIDPNRHGNWVKYNLSHNVTKSVHDW